MRLEFIRFEKILQHRISCAEFERMEIGKKFENDFDDNGLKGFKEWLPWVSIAIGSTLMLTIFFLLIILFIAVRRNKSNSNQNVEMEEHSWGDWPANVQNEDLQQPDQPDQPDQPEVIW